MRAVDAQEFFMFRKFSLEILIPLVFLTILIINPPHGLDYWISQQFYDPDLGWTLHKNFFFTQIIHKGGKVLSGVIYLYFLIRLVWIFKKGERFYDEKKRLSIAIVAGILSLIAVWLLKQITDVPCPWDVMGLGGCQIPVNPFAGAFWGENACWPGGHAGAGFSLLAFFFVYRYNNPRLGLILLVGALALGAIFGFGRMVQGAHFLSHNVSTMLIDWLIPATIFFVYGLKKMRC